MSQHALETRNVSKHFGGERRHRWPWQRRGQAPTRRPVRAVDAVTLTVERGEIYGVLGANGSGKSTLIRMVSTLLLPDAGSIAVFGRDVVREAMAVRRLMNRVSADPSFFRTMSAAENLMFFGRVYGLAPAEVKARIPPIMARLGMAGEKLHEPMMSFSRGQQQKIAVARAFLTAPVLMLLDEPTTGLDPRSKRDVQAFVREVRQDHAATVLLTTHDMEEAELLCDRIAFLAGGRIVAEGTPHALRAGAARRLDQPIETVTMETVFMEITGRSIDEDEEDDGDEPERAGVLSVSGAESR